MVGGISLIWAIPNNTVRPHMGINMLTPREVINLYLKS